MVPKYSHSINEFCFMNNISRNMFYKLKSKGNGPDLIKVGRRTLITVESAQKWLEKLTKQSKKDSAK